VACVDENALTAYFSFRLAPDETTRLFEHLDGCAACARLFNDVAAALTTQDTLPRTAPERDGSADAPLVLGRYRIDRVLGMGGMGVVYAGFDPQLERKVAIKLLQPDSKISAGTLRTRLVREAQAMAQLSHPNVINVFEVGTFGEQVFVVMELIDGTTLAGWLREKERSWREIVAAFVAAGSGLEAAHRAGIIHRDFKPDNVLVGKDGRICVTDFGLARRAEGAEEAAAPSPVSPIDATVTRSGLLVGTPAYMAPEQMRGEPTDERTDVFSFCIALYEALYGARPYPGKTLDELRASIEAGRRSPPRRSIGPATHRRAIERGLAPRPDERPAMGDLLASLRVDPTRRRRRVVAAGLVAIAFAASGLAYLRLQQRVRLCAGSELRLAGIWDPARKTQIERALRAAGGERAWSLVAARLDKFAAEWVAMSASACEAARLRKSESEALFDRRTRCLDERLSELRAASDLFAAADKDVVAHAAELAATVSGLERCADTARLLLNDVDPPRAEQRAAVASLQDRFARMHALGTAGKFGEEEALLPQAVADAHALGRGDLECYAQLALAANTFKRGHAAEALPILHRAVLAGERTRNDDCVAQGWRRITLYTVILGRPSDALLWADYSDAADERIREEPVWRAQTAEFRTLALEQLGRTDEALREARRALALAKEAPDDPTWALGVPGDVGVAMAEMGRASEALPVQREVLARREAELGEDNPYTVSTMGNVVDCLERLERYAEALPLAEKTLAQSVAQIGPEAYETANAYFNLGAIEQGMNRLPAALKHLQRALELYNLHDMHNADYIGLLRHLGETQRALGRPDGTATIERALAAGDEAKLSPLLMAPVRFALAQALPSRDQRRAVTLALEARDAFAVAAMAGVDLAAARRDRVAAWLRENGRD
jgi:tetratricopeptide (TPR) repeat protein/predicted Ser/Thr protein kinase